MSDRTRQPPSAADALTKTLLEITRIDSSIGEEKALCDHVQARLARTLPAAAIARFHDSLVVRVNEQATHELPRVALVGHLDTVRTVARRPGAHRRRQAVRRRRVPT